ncbi:MAG TPA: hypothetical protein ENN60_03215 [archaeon]|nr:hypothetical protein [archaeon]
MIYGDLTRQMERADFQPRHLKWFYPTLILPLLIIPLNLLVALTFLLALLRLPHFVFWLMLKTRRRQLQADLPLFLYSFSWVAPLYSVPEAIRLAAYGSLKPLCDRVWSEYQAGRSFEASLAGFDLSEEIEEVRGVLLQAYKSGVRPPIFQKLADRLASRNLSDSRSRSSRLQLFTTSYTLASTVLPAVQTSVALATGGSGRALLTALLMSLGLVILWKTAE